MNTSELIQQQQLAAGLKQQELLAAATAVALYVYNVSPAERANKLVARFGGDCEHFDRLFALVDSPCWATEMAAPTALAYLGDAIERYGDEAARRVKINLEGAA